MELEYPAGWSRHEGGSIKRPKLTVLKNQVQLDLEVSQGSDERTYKVKFHASEDFVSLAKDRRAAYTRNGYDWSIRYWPITLTASVMPFKSGIIDGEVVVLDERIVRLQRASGGISSRRSNRLVFVAFDTAP